MKFRSETPDRLRAQLRKIEASIRPRIWEAAVQAEKRDDAAIFREVVAEFRRDLDLVESIFDEGIQEPEQSSAA